MNGLYRLVNSAAQRNFDHLCILRFTFASSVCRLSSGAWRIILANDMAVMSGCCTTSRYCYGHTCVQFVISSVFISRSGVLIK